MKLSTQLTQQKIGELKYRAEEIGGKEGLLLFMKAVELEARLGGINI